MAGHVNGPPWTGPPLRAPLAGPGGDVRLGHPLQEARIEIAIVANRLPIQRRGRRWALSPGGLVSALRPVLAGSGATWVGWPGRPDLALDPLALDGIAMVPVRLSATELAEYYAGMSNGTLWPLFHDRVRPPEFHRHWWRAYQAVNARFAAAAAAHVPPSGRVWVHDYQLTLVPSALRALRPDARIGFFLHIPFPPPQLFAQLPWRRAVLEGLLGADALAFQTANDAEHFRAAAVRYAEAQAEDGALRVGERAVHVDAVPIGIDAAAFEAEAGLDETRRRVEGLRELLGGRTIFLGVDRLDYTKGIVTRLRAFDALLDRHPSLAASCVFLQVCVPSREAARGYGEARAEIERLIGNVNGRHGDVGRVPIHYRYGSLDRAELVAHYGAADIMVVTPPRDGMNLVAKEYVACRPNDDGVLILSEFAGAARELRGAIRINPFDIDGIADAYEHALALGPADQRRRMRRMRAQVREHDVHAWARRAIAAFSGPPEGRGAMPS